MLSLCVLTIDTGTVLKIILDAIYRLCICIVIQLLILGMMMLQYITSLLYITLEKDLVDWFNRIDPGYNAQDNGVTSTDCGDDLIDEDESDDENEITHTVAFKCIGAAHDKNYQAHLEQAYLAFHEQNKPVSVRIRPELIAIDIDYGIGWKHVAYIASELCTYLHPLITRGDILDVYIQHIKYRVDFYRIGFYIKIFIKRRGEWEYKVVRKRLSVR